MELTSGIVSDYIDSLITFLSGLDEPWGIKDVYSRHIYMNEAARLYTNTPKSFNIVHRLDEEFPAEWSELSDDFVEHDKRTECSEQRISVIETHYWYGKKELTPFISEKIPVFDKNKKCIGVIWNAKPLSTLSPLIYVDRKKPTVLKTTGETDVFTRSELDTMFLMLRRFSSKEIARQFNISYKTIENRIFNIYQKSGVHSISQFEEYCRTNHLDNYIPHSLITKGVFFL
ncbi:helix-turn-helix transcriptional regulator [Musicola paradisiaca]|uniref:Transcriptional regulator, LuxR family n=1 Tax=Musicola paradisiaca (strain Ech703) TaxID=579405 RepID=C6CD95_MUSP7|nr:LuxR C-terminal-related transcriptional regulator [Musicola paradisiaca]ACS86966.1 transcriptional regulator, LuxR family [Musicola paradisiaca Ech703]